MLAVLTDFPEEGWPSMDLVGDMLLYHLPRHGPLAMPSARLCPPFRRLASRMPVVGRRHTAFNADRLLNRFLFFRRSARQAISRFDLFHVADHTYAQLVHALPAGRTGVYCHDLDAFRCLFDSESDPRPGGSVPCRSESWPACERLRLCFTAPRPSQMRLNARD